MLLFTLAACSGGPSSATPSTTPAGKFTPGTYEGEAQGYASTIKVAVTLSADKIEKVEILEQDETEGIRGDGAILVNAEGLRFCDEVGTRDAVSAAAYAK